MKQMTLRLTDELHARLKATAADNKRSLHGQILWLIEAALTTDAAHPSVRAPFNNRPNSPLT